MTDYNDGQWHGWNGGECPVAANCIVEGIYLSGDRVSAESPVTDLAKEFDWNREAAYDLIAFRVIEKRDMPREFWITIYDGMAWDTMDQAEKHNASLGVHASQIIHVREVQP